MLFIISTTEATSKPSLIAKISLVAVLVVEYNDVYVLLFDEATASNKHRNIY